MTNENTKTWLYSLIELRLDRKAMPIVFGVVLFQPDNEFLVQFAEEPAAYLSDQDRWKMAARALVKRLFVADPHTAEDIKAFIGGEANEMRLGMPYSYEVKDSINAQDNLRALAFLHFAPQ